MNSHDACLQLFILNILIISRTIATVMISFSNTSIAVADVAYNSRVHRQCKKP